MPTVTTKRAFCVLCSVGPLHPIWEATDRIDANGVRVPVWECRCCHGMMPRRGRKASRSAAAALLASEGPCSLDDALTALRSDRA